MNRSAFFASLALTSVVLQRAAVAQESAKTLDPVNRATSWLNGRPAAADLHDRVVLIDIFTFECINCTRVTPNLKSLYSRYSRRQLEIVAVHTPEVPAYQKRMSYLAQQVRLAALPWPIAVDNDYRIWNAYGIDAWPTQLVFDRTGRLVARIVGDGQDGELDRALARAIG